MFAVAFAAGRLVLSCSGWQISAAVVSLGKMLAPLSV